MRIATATEVKQAELSWAHQHNRPTYELMQQAAQACFALLQPYLSHNSRILVLVGSGNNGGDGLLLAHLLTKAGYCCQTLLVRGHIKADIDAWQAYLHVKDRIHFVVQPEEVDWVVDAMVGSGLQSQLDAALLHWVRWVNESKAKVLAIDVPTGLHSDLGYPMPEAIKAELCLAMIAAKPGQWLNQGPDYCGQLQLETLSVTCQSQTYQVLAEWQTPKRASDWHKGRGGHLLIIGGQANMGGAVILAALGAFAVGVGKVTVCCDPRHQTALMVSVPEAIFVSPEHMTLEGIDGVVLGPGLGQDRLAWFAQTLGKIIERQLPLVLDADGLNQLAQSPQQYDNWVMTPHPKEAARLLNQDFDAQWLKDRLAIGQALQAKYGGVQLIKGRGTLVQDAQRCYLIQRGHPYLGTAGSGDVLAGVIGGLWASTELDVIDVVAMAAHLHGWAGERLAAKAGLFRASQLADEISSCFG